MIYVLLVDDHPSVGHGTKVMIEKEGDITVKVVSSSIEALHMIENETYDLLLFDLFMPALSGLELTKRALKINPDIPVLIYTGFDITPHFNILIEAGVTGFISKTSTEEQLITAIRCALRDEAVIPKFLLRQLRRTDAKITGEAAGKSIEEVSINEKEQEILTEVAHGKSNMEIAQKLLMSKRSVEYHLTKIFEKLHVSSRAEAVREARNLGILAKEELV